MTRTDLIFLWILRVVWVSLPVTVGGVLASAVESWSAPVRVVLEVIAWGTWAGVLIAVGVPRPMSLSVVRVALPITTIAALAAVPASDGWQRWVAVVVIVAACALALSGWFAIRCVDGASYGEERRVPLRIPPGLFLAPLPLAIAVIGTAVVVGPALLAARAWAAGVVTIVAGVPAALVAARAIHGLSRRMVVLVPAGMVLADPATIDDAVLFRRETVRGIRAVGVDTDVSGALDLRLGARRGSLRVDLAPEADAVHVRRGRRDAEAVSAAVVMCAVVGRDEFLDVARARRLPVHRADS